VARIRTIKPEFPQSESVGRLSRDARLLFIQLWTLADDSGRLRGNSRMLASLLYPYDDDAGALLPAWLQELISAGTVRRYEVDGETFLDIPKWLNHQKIDKPSPSKLPPFSGEFAKPREDSEKNAADQGRDQGSRIKEGKEQGAGSPPADPGPVWKESLTILTEQGQSEKTARSFLGMLCRDYDEGLVADAVKQSVGKANITAYVRGILKDAPKKHQPEPPRLAL